MISIDRADGRRAVELTPAELLTVAESLRGRIRYLDRQRRVRRTPAKRGEAAMELETAQRAYVVVASALPLGVRHALEVDRDDHHQDIIPGVVTDPELADEGADA